MNIRNVQLQEGTLTSRFLRESARPDVIRKSTKAAWLIVATVCFGAFMGQLDASIVTLAFPSLEHQFHTVLGGVEWVSLSYLITLIIFLVPIGKLSDRYGRKLFYLYGFVLFTIASAACGLAPSLLLLVIFRVVQAVGAAMLQGNSVALITTNVPAEHKRTALGIQASAQSLGLALGPLLGGLLVGSVGWRWIFLINAPVGIVAVVLGYFLLPRTRERAPTHNIDRVGLSFLAVAVIATLVFISGISGLGLSGIESAILAIVSISAIVGLLRWENRTKLPLIDFKILQQRKSLHMLVGALLAYMVLFGPLVLFPQILATKGYSIMGTGLLLSTLPIGFGIAAIGAEYIIPRHWHDHSRALIGGLIATFAAILLAIPFPVVFILAALGLLGIGLGIYIPANNTLIMSSIPKHEAATTGGMVNIARGLGTAFGVALVTLVLDITAHLGIDTSLATAMIVLSIAVFTATLTGYSTRSHISPDATSS